MRHGPLPLATALLLLLAVPARGAGEEAWPDVDPKAVLEHVRWLADEDREGRAAGSNGAHAAAEYLAQHLERLGAEPLGDGESFYQRFPIPQGFDVLPATRVEISGEKAPVVEAGEDLTVLSVSAAGEVEAPAVFVGYGISAPELSYDDYADLDVKGRVALVLRHAPAWEDRRSPFHDPRVLKRYGTFEAKVSTAVAAGAAAVLIVNDPVSCWKPKDDVLEAPSGGGSGQVPALHLTFRGSRRLLKTCDLNLQREQKAIDARMAPRSRELEGVRIRAVAALEARRLEAWNVCGVLRAPEGTTATDEHVVVGAHFDHLGRGEFGSLAGSKGKGKVHVGADDNASGTAAVLEIATLLAARRAELRRDVVFVLFTGEEMGLLGSKHYVEQPCRPLDSCVAMLNLDMVGRLERGKLQVGGVGTSPVFPETLEAAGRAHRLPLKLTPGGRAPTDSASFYEKGIPVLFFFTGLHGDYHRPDDDVQGVDARGLAKVTALAAAVCLDLSLRPDRPPFSRSDATGMEAGPHLGLSCEQRSEGVVVVFVEAKSPAADAGFEVGDRVESFDDTTVRTLSDFQDAHRRARPRARVTITVRRGTRLLDLEPRLGRE